MTISEAKATTSFCLTHPFYYFQGLGAHKDDKGNYTANIKRLEGNIKRKDLITDGALLEVF